MLDSGVIRPSRSPWAAPVVLAPRIDDTVDALNGARFLSAFDMLAGYWQVGLGQGDARKTAFTTHEGLFEWTCMPFGLSGAPATFQRMMDTVLAGLKWQCCLVYLDDVVVFSRTFDDHLRDLKLGYLVTPEGVKPDPSKVKAIQEYPTPKDISGVHTFLGMTGHYRQFIPFYASMTTPLKKLRF